MGEVTLSMWRADSTFKNQMPNETAALPFEGGRRRESTQNETISELVAQLLRRPSAASFHCATLSAIMRVDFIAAWLSWA
jgi:hypothetical protein